jgi:hypothetical protein
MLDKTKNLFTCDKDGKRYPVCSHVRAWVKTQMADEYTKGYAAGCDATRYMIGDFIKRQNPKHITIRYCFTQDELTLIDYGYVCLKQDILNSDIDFKVK